MKKVDGSLAAIAFSAAVLAAAVCIAGFLPGKAAGPGSFVSIRGETVALAGSGLYRLDSVSFAAQAHAQDAVTLGVGIPLLLASLLFAARGSLRGGMTLAGTFAYFAYTYATYVFGTYYNPCFLAYAALLSLSVSGLILSLARIDPVELKRRFAGPAVRLAAIAFDFFVGIMIFLMWMARILPALFGGADATLIEHYTTLPIQAMDLAFVVPLALTAGVSLLRGRPLGYLLTGLFLVKGLSLGLALAVMIVWSAALGLPVNPGETVVFALIIAAGLSISVLFIRSIRPEKN